MPKADKSLQSWEDAVRWLIDQPDRQDLVEACYFDQPLTRAAERFHKGKEWQAVSRFLPSKGGRALELGAGNGILSYALACDGWAVTAVEPDPSNLVGAGAIRKLAIDSKQPIEVIEAFGESIPLEKAGFDLAIARQVLHHADDLEGLCSELARIVRPGGLVITLRDHVISGPDQLQPFLDGHPLHHLYGGENAYTLGQYKKALTGAGLEIIHELAPLKSVINYAPLSKDELLDGLSGRLKNMPVLGPGAAGVARLVPADIMLSLASMIDRRPGRLYSFICRKPA